MKNKNLIGIIKIVLFSFVAILSTYIFLKLLTGQVQPSDLYVYKEPNIIVQEITLKDKIDNIDLKWYSGGMKITKSKDENIHVTEKSSKQLEESKWLKPTVDNKTLVLHSENKNKVFLFFNRPATSFLELKLPDKEYNDFKASLTSGKYSISDFKVNNIKIEMTSGNVNLNNITNNNLDVEMTSGVLLLNDLQTNNFDLLMTSGNADFIGKISQSGNIEMTSGNLNLDTSKKSPESLDIEMTSGNAILTLTKQQGFQINIDKTSGSLNLDPSFKKINDNLYKNQDSNIDYFVEMTSGNLNINLN